MIRVEDVSKHFDAGGQRVSALRNVRLHIRAGEFVAVMGPSGSGKSTLLQLLGGLDLPDEGEIIVDGVHLARLNERERTLFRRRKIGIVFQNYQLLPLLTAEENVAFALHTDRVPSAEAKARSAALLAAVGLAEQARRFPAQLSGGQQQRVAIARALAMRPCVVLADEPTGNLDRKKGNEILQLLSGLQQAENVTLIMVTHDMYAAGFADRIVRLRDGQVTEETARKEDGGDVLLANFLAKPEA